MALRYQVASRPIRAKFGKRLASSRRSGRISDVAGSSSNTITTIGGRADAAAPAPDFASACGVIRSLTGEKSRNSARKTAGAAPSTVNTERAGTARAYSAAAPAPRASESGTQQLGLLRQRALEDLQQQRRHQQGDQGQHHDGAGLAGDQPREEHEQRQHQRRHQHEREREDQYVAGRVVARDEERRVLAQDVEQRLHEGQRPQPGELQRRHGQRRRQVRHPRTDASNSTRVPEGSSSRLWTSKRSSRQRSKCARS